MKLFTFFGKIIFSLLFVFLLTGCESDSGSDNDLGDSWLKIAGGEYSLAKLDINNDGEVGGAFPGVYKHYITIASEDLNLYPKPGSGKGEYISITFFSSEFEFPQDDYDFSSGDPAAGQFRCDDDAYIIINFVLPDATGTVYEITGGTITVNFDGTDYYISGNVTTSAGGTAFRYLGPVTE